MKKFGNIGGKTTHKHNFKISRKWYHYLLYGLLMIHWFQIFLVHSLEKS